jgi:hypothetical protein
MSALANSTDFQVIGLLTNCLKILERTDQYRITKTDDFEISLAKNMLKSVIENNPHTIEIKSK